MSESSAYDIVLNLVTCPITKKVMKQPVTLSNGQTFEKEEILKHFSQYGENETIQPPEGCKGNFVRELKPKVDSSISGIIKKSLKEEKFMIHVIENDLLYRSQEVIAELISSLKRGDQEKVEEVIRCDPRLLWETIVNEDAIIDVYRKEVRKEPTSDKTLFTLFRLVGFCRRENEEAPSLCYPTVDQKFINVVTHHKHFFEICEIVCEKFDSETAKNFIYQYCKMTEEEVYQLFQKCLERSFYPRVIHKVFDKRIGIEERFEMQVILTNEKFLKLEKENSNLKKAVGILKPEIIKLKIEIERFKKKDLEKDLKISDSHNEKQKLKRKVNVLDRKYTKIFKERDEVIKSQQEIIKTIQQSTRENKTHLSCINEDVFSRAFFDIKELCKTKEIDAGFKQQYKDIRNGGSCFGRGFVFSLFGNEKNGKYLYLYNLKTKENKKLDIGFSTFHSYPVYDKISDEVYCFEGYDKYCRICRFDCVSFKRTELKKMNEERRANTIPHPVGGRIYHVTYSDKLCYYSNETNEWKITKTNIQNKWRTSFCSHVEKSKLWVRDYDKIKLYSISRDCWIDENVMCCSKEHHGNFISHPILISEGYFVFCIFCYESKKWTLVDPYKKKEYTTVWNGASASKDWGNLSGHFFVHPTEKTIYFNIKNCWKKVCVK